jgi:trigger factor
MQHTLKHLDKSKIELIITVPVAEYQASMQSAAVRISERAAIKGFRPGKAPYNVVKEQIGEIKILEEATQSIVEKNYYEAVKAENLETIGMPQISLQKFAPGNDLEFKAEVALLPKVTLADISKIKVDKKEVKATPAQVDDMLSNLKKMQAKEVVKNGAATKEDKLLIDLDMFIENVPIEGGQAKNHQVYLNESHYIPGLAEELVGLKKDGTKEFNLKFPTEHYQKHIAGKNVDFKVKVNEVFELQLPDINDEFAKALGQESLTKLKELLTANITKEEEKKEDQRIEAAILDQMIEQSTFEEIPDTIITAEKQKMFYELKHDLDERGISMEQYLQDIKKTEDQIFQEFQTGAEKRAKAALISRQVSKDNNMVVSKEELDQEIAAIRAAYPDNEQVAENLKRAEVIDTIASTIQNRKVMSLLKEKIVK